MILRKSLQNNWRNRRLQTKLILSYLVLVIIPILIVNTLYVRARKDIEESSVKYIRLYADQINISINNYINEIERMMNKSLVDYKFMQLLKYNEMFSPVEKMTYYKDINNYLFQLLTQKPDVNTIMILTASGDFFSIGKYEQLIRKEDLMAQDWFQQIQANENALVISAAHQQTYNVYGNNQTQIVVSTGKLIKDELGRVLGTIIFDVDYQNLLQLTRSEDNQADFQTRIIATDQDGKAIFDTEADQGAVDLTSLVKLEKSMSTMMIGSERFVEIHNRSEYTKLFIFIIVPERVLYHQIINFQQATLVLSIIGIGLIIIISIWLSFYITRPVKSLKRDMETVEKGDLGVQARIISRDEIGSLAVSFNLMIDKIRTMIDREYAAQLRAKQAQLQALQNQINPHFLYNTLESIRMKAILNHDQETASMIKSLGKLFRSSLSNTQDIVPIRQELEHARAFIELQNIRYDNRFCLQCNLDEAILDSGIFKLTFQTIVENSLIHGFAEKTNDCAIEISGTIQDDQILLRFKDNGAGIPAARLDEITRSLAAAIEMPEDSGIGLRNISSRIKLLFGEPYYLQVLSTEGQGTVIELFLPSIKGA